MTTKPTRTTQLADMSLSCDTTTSNFTDHTAKSEKAYRCIKFKSPVVAIYYVYISPPLLELTVEEFLSRYNLGLISITFPLAIVRANLFIQYLTEIITND